MHVKMWSGINMLIANQAQASEQFLASINLASNKAICLKTKIINKSNLYFQRFLTFNNKYITVNA
jgi:hypothetical protein